MCECSLQLRRRQIAVTGFQEPTLEKTNTDLQTGKPGVRKVGSDNPTSDLLQPYCDFVYDLGLILIQKTKYNLKHSWEDVGFQKLKATHKKKKA